MNETNLAHWNHPSDRFQPRLFEEDKMTPSVDAAIRQLLCACFPGDTAVFRETRYWHGSAPAFSFAEEGHGRINGHVGVVVRAITCGATELTVAGIQNLAVLPELRGSGLGRKLVVQSMIEAKSRGLVYGLLFCVPALRRFYESLGWFTVDAAVRMLDGQGAKTQLPENNICLAICLGSSPFPEGNIDLQGADW